MISSSFRENPQPKYLLKYRFPLWLTIFFLLLILIPIFIFSDQLLLAKIIGIICLILVIIALRIWLIISRINSSKVGRVVLNKNQLFELERKYSFLNKLSNSNRQILFHRAGLLLAEISFNSEDGILLIDKIEIAFNISILLLDDEYKSYQGLSIEISKFNSNKDISLTDVQNLYSKNMTFSAYKSKLSESDIYHKVRVKLSDY